MLLLFMQPCCVVESQVWNGFWLCLLAQPQKKLSAGNQHLHVFLHLLYSCTVGKSSAYLYAWKASWMTRAVWGRSFDEGSFWTFLVKAHFIMSQRDLSWLCQKKMLQWEISAWKYSLQNFDTFWKNKVISYSRASKIATMCTN